MVRIRSDSEEEVLAVREDEEDSLAGESSSSGSVGSEENNKTDVDIGEISFSPPLYRQRYTTVSSILESQEGPPLKRVLDAGCAEGTFISIYLKKLPDLEEIVGLDVDDFALDEGKRRTAPLIYEHLHPRKNPLDIYLLQGDVGTLDERLRGMDAVVALEVIEHLQEDTLLSFQQVVFGAIKPRLVVLTTPNVEYNVLFPNCNTFRHPDHKFEWTRDEFKAWCEEITEEFSEYSVSYTGVGFSSDRPDVGPCSQIAIFTSSSQEQLESPSYIRSVSEETLHPLVHKVYCHHIYPVSKDHRSFEEKLIGNLEFYISDCTREKEEDTYLSLPFLSKFSLVAELTTDVEVIRRILLDNSWEVVDLEGEYHVVVPPMLDEYLTSSCCDDDSDEYNPDDFYVPDSNRNFIEEEDFWD